MIRVLAIARLRATLRWRTLRGSEGVPYLAGAVLLAGLGAGLALAMAAGFGALVHYATRTSDLRTLRAGYLIIFYTFFFFAVLLPLLRGVMERGFDARSFRRFPITRGKLYGIALAASFGNPDHLLYYPALASIAIVGVLLPGQAVGGGLLTLGLVVLFCVVWSHTLTLAFETLLRSRRIKEIVALLLLLVLVGVALASPLLEPDMASRPDAVGRLVAAVQAARELGRWLPLSKAAEAMLDLHLGRAPKALLHAAWLGLWTVAGAGIGYYVFARHHYGDRGRTAATPRPRSSPSRRLRLPLPSIEHDLLSFLPIEIRGLAAKETRYLFRSVVGRFNLLMMPALVAIVAFLVRRAAGEPLFGLDPERFALFGSLLYATLFSNNFVNNAFAWEGRAVSTYFTTPLSPRKVLAGKNLGVWLYNGALLTILLAVWVALVGRPHPLTLVGGVLLFGGALLGFTTTGNFVSVLLPVRRDISSVTNTPAQLAVLFGMVSLVAVSGLASLALALPLWIGRPAWQPLCLGALLVAHAALYVVSLRPAGRLLDQRREILVSRLSATD